MHPLQRLSYATLLKKDTQKISEIYTFAYGLNILSFVILKSYFWIESVQGLNLQDLSRNILKNALQGTILG